MFFSGAELARRKQNEGLADLVAEPIVNWVVVETEQQVRDRLLAAIGTLAMAFSTKAQYFKSNDKLGAFLAANKANMVAAKEVASVLGK